MNSPSKELKNYPVLLWIPGASNIFGGHRVQFELTGKYLSALGWDVSVDFTPQADLSKFRVVHGLGLSPEQIARCKRLGAAVLLSTVYSSMEYCYPTYRTRDWLKNRLRRSKVAAKAFLQIIKGTGTAAGFQLAQSAFAQKARYELADILLPNSELEKACIIRELNVQTPQVVVPNSADPNIFHITENWEKRRNVVVYCGRIEPHKNQLNLIKATAILKVPLILVGPPHPDHSDYYDACLRQAHGQDVTFVGMQKQEDLVSLYNSAKVHVVPSWWETTGLVSLESILCGCNVVSTNKGFASEYLRDHAEYCDPDSVTDIARATKSALARQPDPAFTEYVRQNYCWERTAEKTSAAYLEALESAKRERVVLNR